MSGEIIQFVPRARRDRSPVHASTVSYLPPRVSDLTMDHADTAPCEYAPICEEWHGED